MGTRQTNSGGFVHNRVLLDPIQDAALRLGASAQREVATGRGRHGRYGDLLIQLGSHQILVEAELSSKRIANDLAKAEQFQSTELWIVVPTSRVARSVRQELLRLSVPPNKPGLFVLLLPQALERLMSLFSLNSGSYVRAEKPENKLEGSNDSANQMDKPDCVCHGTHRFRAGGQDAS